MAVETAAWMVGTMELQWAVSMAETTVGLLAVMRACKSAAVLVVQTAARMVMMRVELMVASMVELKVA